ncbi:MAG TPA: hypothetical protein DHV59_07780 [Oxalobacteraceae bacterium]|nr:hypothetical protein [Oxalobacteraceae bacterium]
MSWGAFKETSFEVGSWLYGALQGGFNEKQTIGQVTTDAVISMFPIAGEITAARDVIASSIRLSQSPEKRQEVVEWVMLILPLLALIPLLGGALKGVGKLLLMVGKHVDEDKKILEAIISLLNKVGHGDAVRFIKNLDFTEYRKPIVDGVNSTCERIKAALSHAQKRMGSILPQAVIDRFNWLSEQLNALQNLASKMVPQALKDLNNRLKYIQKLMYEGEWHMIPGSGKAITRETEARLVTKAGRMEWELKNAPYPQNEVADFKYKDGWPNFTDTTEYKIEKGNAIIKSFHGMMNPVELKEGTVIYRVIDHKFGEPNGAYWMYVDPKSIKGWYWRVKFAVLQSWSHNGKYVKYIIPKGKSLRAWEGKVSSQIENDIMRNSRDVKNLKVPNEGFGQYLEGGEAQLFIDFKFTANKWAASEVSLLKKLDTNWVDHMGINLIPKTAGVQKLGQYVEEQKTLASANLSTAANQSGKSVRSANQDVARTQRAY